jgi:hypothetical protein
LVDLYDCAPSGTVLRVVGSPADADLVLRLGEPGVFTGSAYRIGLEQVLVMTPRQSSVEELSVGETRDLFAGPGDPSLQVWVYAKDEDIQRLFTQGVMGGRPVTTQARLATSPEHMRDELADSPEAIGFLPGRWDVKGLRVVYTLTDVPVLALLPEEPQGVILSLLACAQE